MTFPSENDHGPNGSVEDGPSTTLAQRDVEWRCAARHLTVAAWELANDPNTPPDLAAHYATAEVQFRIQVQGFSGILRAHPPEGPTIRLPDRQSISVIALLADIIRREPMIIPYRSIEREFVHGAKELLCGIQWSCTNQYD